MEIDKTIDILSKTHPLVKGHIHQKTDMWTLSGWKSDEVHFNNTKIIDEIEKLEYELYNDYLNGKSTTPRPFYLQNVPNILTLIGLKNSAQLDTGEHTNSNTHSSIGSGTTAATENDTDLVTEFTNTLYARKAFSVDGQRKVVNQTAKYGMLWDDTSFDTTPQSINESGIHWNVSAASTMHARVTFTTFTMNAGDLFVIQINELQANA